MTGHLYELTDAEAATLAAAARILAERTIGSVWAVSVRAGAGHARMVAHMQSGSDVGLEDVGLEGGGLARRLTATVREHNARRSAR